MKKSILTAIICFASLLFSSCGTTTVKVKLIGDEHLSWGKSEDTAKLNENYVITAKPDRGYALFKENLFIYSNGRPLSDVAKQYELDEDTQILTIYKKNIYGDIEITGSSAERDYVISYVYNSDDYENISEDNVTITSSTLVKTITPKNGKTLKLDGLKAFPDDVKKISYVEESEKGKLTINNSEFYRDIVITLPDLD